MLHKNVLRINKPSPCQRPKSIKLTNRPLSPSLPKLLAAQTDKIRVHKHHDLLIQVNEAQNVPVTGSPTGSDLITVINHFQFFGSPPLAFAIIALLLRLPRLSLSLSLSQIKKTKTHIHTHTNRDEWPRLQVLLHHQER